MKAIMLTVTMILYAMLCMPVHADLNGTFKTITLDGSLADWSNPGDVIYEGDEIGVGTPANSTYEVVYLANDAANLYVGLDTAGTGGGSITNTWTRNIYLDTDRNGNTGYKSTWFANGYDRLIQYGASGSSYSVFEFNGATQADWGWNFLGLISYSFNEDIAELSVPLASLGLSGGDSFVVEFNVTGGDVTAETWASAPEANAETYTIATFSGTYPVITVDGSLDEWNNPGDVFYNDSEIRDGLPANSAYENLYLANDAINLYIGLDTKESDGGSISNTWTRNIYLDTDVNGGTGFNGGWMAHGYDRLIQYGASGTTYSVYEFTGANQDDWGWSPLGEIMYAYSNDAIELSLPLYLLGVSVGDPMVVTFNVSGDGITEETWAAGQETDAKTYALLDNGEPPPVVPIGSIVIAGPVSVAEGQGMALSWVTAAAQSYAVEYSSNLLDGGWSLYTNFVGSGGEITVTTSVDQAKTFYRVVTPFNPVTM